MTLHAALGAILSVYAVYVEHKMAHKPADEDFSALCDIESIGASCSAVFQLPEGRMLSFFGLVPAGSILDVPNAVLGILYYSLWLTVMTSLPHVWRLFIASLAMSSSIFLATKLFLLSELCLLCLSTHVINARLWWGAYTSFRAENDKSSNRGQAKIKRV